jgi:predicted ATPase
MRLRSVRLSRFKNLRDFTITFSRQGKFTVLLGNNGSGKSNLIEALVVIFRDLDLDAAATITYEVNYVLGADHSGTSVRLTSTEGKHARISIDGQEEEVFRLAKHEDYLPRFVFAYYSGSSNRLESHFAKSRQRFYDRLKKRDAESAELPLRRLFLAQQVHSQFVLLAFFTDPDPTGQQFLTDQFQIESLRDVQIVVRRPGWSKARDDRYWGTTGAPRRTMELLDQYSLSALEEDRNVEVTFRKRGARVESITYLLDSRGLQRLYDEFGTPQDLFKALESLLISDLLLEIIVRVEIRGLGTISFKELSEGEQQLLLVLGLLRFTRQSDSLFLLDEPDTHLNPQWALRYRDFIQLVVENSYRSHVLCATHDPLTFCGAVRDDVRVLRVHEDRNVTAAPAEHNPRGLGVSGILTSEMFGLQAALDLETQEQLRDLRQLEARETLTADEAATKNKLSRDVSRLGFMVESDDPIFAGYLEAYQSLFGKVGGGEGESLDLLRERAKAALAAALNLDDDASH